MILTFFGFSIILAVVVLIGAVALRRYKHPLRRSVQLLFVLAAITVLCNAMAVITTTEWLVTFWQGLYFAATDWLVLVLLLFTRKYTESQKKISMWAVLIAIGAVADTVSMLANVFTHHVFRCVQTTIFNGELCLTVEPNYPMYGVHLAYAYLSVVVVLGILIIRTLQMIPIYRGKNEVVLWSFLLILVVNIWCRMAGLPLDLSPLIYGVLAFACYYITFRYVPKGIVIKLLAVSVEDMEAGILCFDRDGRCVYANEQGMRIFGADRDYGPIERFYAQRKGGGDIVDFQEGEWEERFIIDKQAHDFDVKFKMLTDDKGRYIGCFFVMDDRTEERQKLEIQRYRATHDKLTDIYTRERFFERVRELLDAEPEVKRVIVCTDIKDFKVVNDLFGEETGNLILKKVADIMRREVSADTLYGRLEADRFALCMREENFHEEDYAKYLEELKGIIQSSVYRMHLHVGVYHIIDPTMMVSVMCDRCFVAIRNIKEDYQQVVSYYSETMGGMVQREQVMVGEFERALRAEEFRMYLQPQISTNQELLGAEALVRWDHPVRGMISPAEFIPVFERCGYIPRLDRFMWEQACRQLSIWKRTGKDQLHISVNISPKDFYYIDIYEVFTGLVEKYDIDPSRLKLEITETALMEEMNKQMDLLQRLRNYGFHVEIDDFGSGYSSLNTLKDIEVDVLKLDMGFLHDTGHKDRSKIIMNATIDMAKRLGLTVVTEGVETVEQVEYLTGVGCDVFQGYYFARPMPVKDFEKKYSLTEESGHANV